jgi:hypothetical protein
MGCNCGKRRELIGQARQDLRARDYEAARRRANEFVQTVKTDFRSLGGVVRSAITLRPPMRVR